MLENDAYATSITRVIGAPTDLAPITTPVDPAATGLVNTTSVPVTQLSKLTGITLLEQLSLLPKSDLSAFVTGHPSAIHQLVTNPPLATSVSNWWVSLSPKTQAQFAATAPEVAGNLEGLPFAVRDTANRAFLKTSISAAKTQLASGIGRAELVGEKHHLEILQQIARTLDTTKNSPQRQLLTFDPAGDARAAVVVGNLQTADYVSYLVPGMFFTVQGQIYDWTTIAQDLYKEQQGWLKTLSTVDPSYTGKTTATVAWIGYSTPGVLDLASLTDADQGASYLGDALNGVKAARAGNEPFVTLITHSYGSTAAMIELSKNAVSVNALAIIGSPGSATQKASELNVKNDNVFVGEAALDPVVNTAFYGSDPGSSSFGAKKMDVASGTDVITGKQLGAAVGHLGYFDPGTQAMRNLALIGLNQGSLVTDGSLADASRTLASR